MCDVWRPKDQRSGNLALEEIASGKRALQNAGINGISDEDMLERIRIELVARSLEMG